MVQMETDGAPRRPRKEYLWRFALFFGGVIFAIALTQAILAGDIYSKVIVIR